MHNRITFITSAAGRAWLPFSLADGLSSKDCVGYGTCNWRTLRVALGLTLALVVCVGTEAAGQVRRADRPVTPPPPLSAPAVDVRVVEGRQKHAARRGMIDGEPQQSPKTDSNESLDRKIDAGDLQAAIIKADRARNGIGRATTLPNAANIEALFDQGMAQGIAGAFSAKAEMDMERGGYSVAVDRLHEASRRGDPGADYRLALIKAQRPYLSTIEEVPLALLNRAAARGDSKAALELGLALQRGAWFVAEDRAVMVEESAEEAVTWMERADQLGEPQASFWLGMHYMETTTGLTDPARERALHYLLRIRQESDQLTEPRSGKTFAELEVDGMIEPGLLSELKRREARVASANRSRSRLKAPVPSPIQGPNWKKLIDHQVLEIVGDDAGGASVYNLVGLSPYKEIAVEGSVVAFAEHAIIPSVRPGLKEVSGWRIELFNDAGFLDSFRITAIDLPRKRVSVDRDVPSDLAGNVQCRVVRYHTVFSTFGDDNRAGLRPGVAPDSADELVVFGSSAAEQRRFFYHSKRLQWIDSVSGQPLLEDLEINPGSGLLIKRSEPGSLSLQVRGMRPAEPLRFAPAPGVTVISTRKNAFASEVSSVPVKKTRTVATDELFVLKKRKGGDRSGWEVDSDAKGSKWWSAIGLDPAARVNVVGGSAAVVVNS